MSETKDTAIKQEHVQLRNQVARVMWDVDVKGVEFQGISDRNEKYSEVREDYQRRAAAIVRQLKKRGVEMTPAASDSADE